MFIGSLQRILLGSDRRCSKGEWSWHVTTAAAKKERERKRKRRAVCRALTDRGFKAKERSSMSLLKEEE